MNTILVTVDALRADHLGQYGYERNTMPVLDRLTEEGTIFTNAFSNGPYTRISVPSFHTSTYLAYQNITSLPTIASELADDDIHTACIGTRTGFSSVEGDLHFDEYIDLGRDEYHEESEKAHSFSRKAVESLGDTLQSIKPVYNAANAIYERVDKFGITHFSYKGYQSAECITDKAIAWLDNHSDTDFFLWIHYMEGHRPYGVHDEDPQYTSPISDDRIRKLMKTAGTEPEQTRIEEHKKIIDLYDSDLRYCSHHFDRFLDKLRELELFSDTNLLFTSDHGEEFYDHGMYYHRNLPYDELLHVPLILRSPNETSEKVTSQRELLDIAPTILDFHSIEKPETFNGSGLFTNDEREIIAVGSQSQDGQTIAVRNNGYKYIWTEGEEKLFDLSVDQLEEHNIVNEASEQRHELRDCIPSNIFTAEEEQLRDPSDTVEKKQLEALGYLET